MVEKWVQCCRSNRQNLHKMWALWGWLNRCIKLRLCWRSHFSLSWLVTFIPLNVNMANKFKKLVYIKSSFFKSIYILKGNWKSYATLYVKIIGSVVENCTTTIGWYGRSLYENFYLQVINDPMQMSMFARNYMTHIRAVAIGWYIYCICHPASVIIRTYHSLLSVCWSCHLPWLKRTDLL